MTLWRRFLVLAALAFWQGGFAFYAAVVVPLGERVLGSATEQGFVTRSVTNYLNLAAAIALPVLLCDILAVKARRRTRIVAWTAMALALLLQVWLHPRLDQLLDVEAKYVLDHDQFYVAHEVYLIASAVQWLGAIVFVISSLQAWDAPLPNTRVASDRPVAARHGWRRPAGNGGVREFVRVDGQRETPPGKPVASSLASGTVPCGGKPLPVPNHIATRRERRDTRVASCRACPISVTTQWVRRDTRVASG